MKKGKKIILIIAIVITFCIIDSLFALIFDISPFIKIRDYYNGGKLHYKDRGILTDTYCGINGKKDTVVKGFRYSLSYDDYEIVDTSKKN